MEPQNGFMVSAKAPWELPWTPRKHGNRDSHVPKASRELQGSSHGPLKGMGIAILIFQLPWVARGPHDLSVATTDGPINLAYMKIHSRMCHMLKNTFGVRTSKSTQNWSATLSYVECRFLTADHAGSEGEESMSSNCLNTTAQATAGESS